MPFEKINLRNERLDSIDSIILWRKIKIIKLNSKKLLKYTNGFVVQKFIFGVESVEIWKWRLLIDLHNQAQEHHALATAN
jgi:hypothetical protein